MSDCSRKSLKSLSRKNVYALDYEPCMYIKIKIFKILQVKQAR
jgi:hypothetical protein